MDDIAKRLQAPFSEDEIEWRVDRGYKGTSGNFVYVLTYISNRAIMNRLDEVFGCTGWKNSFRPWKDGSQLCGISVKCNDEWVTKWDGSDDSNVDAVKGGLSGAMKRAAVQWGVGRYLYSVDQFKVPLLERGDNYANIKVKVNGKDEYIQGYRIRQSFPPGRCQRATNQHLPRQTGETSRSSRGTTMPRIKSLILPPKNHLLRTRTTATAAGLKLQRRLNHIAIGIMGVHCAKTAKSLQ
jgi:hypothetical protein